jgi:hypothetical protein
METRDHDMADPERRERHGYRVSDDLADLPVSDAELDVVEAFLMKQFAAVMAGKSSATELLPAADSPPPQTHAENAPSAPIRRTRR